MGFAFRAPSHIPALADVLRALGADARAAARHLAVAERTVYHWLSTGRAPRAAVLALWWETHEGRAHVALDAVNECQVYRGLAQALERENAALRARIARLEALGDFGSANAPTVRAL